MNKNKLFAIALVSITLVTAFLFNSETTLNYSLAKTGYEIMLFNRKNAMMDVCLEKNGVAYEKFMQCHAASMKKHYLTGTEDQDKASYYACLAKEAPACSDIYFITPENFKEITWKDEVKDKFDFFNYYSLSSHSNPAKLWLYLFIVFSIISYIAIYKHASIIKWLKK